MKRILISRVGKVILALVALLLLTSVAWAANGYEIPRAVIGGGGGHSEEGIYSLDATIGQAIVGQVANSPYDLCAGFWCRVGVYRVYLPLVLRNS